MQIPRDRFVPADPSGVGCLPGECPWYSRDRVRTGDWLSDKGRKGCAQLDYSLMAVLRCSSSLNCLKCTPAEDRCGSATMQRRSTRPTSGSRTLAAPSRISLAGLLMYSDHSLTFSIQVMRNENFGLTLQETSRDGPAETRQGAGMANADRNSRDRGGVRRINISPRTAPASGNRSTHQACHVSMPLRQRESRRGRGAQSVEVQS